MDSLRYTPKHSILPFAREVHFHAKTGEWKDGGIRFLNKIVRAFTGRGPALGSDLKEASSAQAAGVPIDLRRLENCKPLTTHHFRKLDNPPQKLIQTHNTGLAAEVLEAQSRNTAAHLKEEVAAEFKRAVSLESTPLSWDNLAAKYQRTAIAVASSHAAPGRGADPLSQEVDRVNHLWFDSAKAVIENSETLMLGSKHGDQINAELVKLRESLDKEAIDRTDDASINASLKTKVQDTPQKINEVIRKVLKEKYQWDMDEADLARMLHQEYKIGLDTR